MTSRAVKLKRVHAQRGMSLLETMLAVGVSAVFFTFVINLGSTIAREQAIQAAANYVNQIDRGVTQMLADPERFSAIYNVVAAAGGQAQATVANLRNSTGIIGAAVPAIPPSPVIGATFPDPGPLNQTYRVLFRIADNLANPNDTPALETYIASQTMLDDEMALRIAAAMGGKGGTLRNTNNPAAATMTSAFGSWNAQTGWLSATNWYATVTGAAPPTQQNGGYVVAYRYADLDRIAKDYLYRIEVAGRPALNRMESNLDMNNYNLVGVDNITTTGVLTGRDAYVGGTASVGGLTRVTGNMQADGSAAVQGNIESPTNLALNVVGGNLNTVTTTTGGSLFGTSLTTGNLNTGQLSAANATLSGGNFDAVGAGTVYTRASGTGLIANGVEVRGGSYETSALNSGNLTAASNTGSIYMTVNGNYNHAGGNTQANQYGNTGMTSVGNPDFPCANGCGER